MKDELSPLVSIEKFAAYLDGNLSEDESMHIASLMESDEDMQLLLKMSDELDNDMGHEDSLFSNEILTTDVPSDDYCINENTEDMFGNFFSDNEIAVLSKNLEFDTLWTNGVLGHEVLSGEDMNISEVTGFIGTNVDDCDDIL